MPSVFPSADRRPLLRMPSGGVPSGRNGSNPSGCRIAYDALSNIEGTYLDYKNKVDIHGAICRTASVRLESVKSVRAHHESTGCQHCIGMDAFCMLHHDMPEDRPLVEVVCERAKKALPSAYGHLVLGLVFSVVAGQRSLPLGDKELFLRRSIIHLRHCDHLHIGCLYLGHACVSLGWREEAFVSFKKGSELGLRVLCLMESGECYRTGFGVQQDSRSFQQIRNQVDKDSGTLKAVFFKEWEKNVKSGETLVEFFKNWVKEVPTISATPVAGSSVLSETASVVATRSGETPTLLWLYPVCYMSHSVTCCLQLWCNQLRATPKSQPRSGRVI